MGPGIKEQAARRMAGMAQGQELIVPENPLPVVDDPRGYPDIIRHGGVIDGVPYGSMVPWKDERSYDRLQRLGNIALDGSGEWAVGNYLMRKPGFRWVQEDYMSVPGSWDSAPPSFKAQMALEKAAKTDPYAQGIHDAVQAIIRARQAKKLPDTTTLWPDSKWYAPGQDY